MRFASLSVRPLVSLLAPVLPAAALLTGVLLTGCSDDKSSGPTASEKEAMLVGAKWMLTAHKISPAIDYDGQGKMVTDLFAEGDCIHDDTLVFASDHSYAIDAGNTKCDPSEAQKETGTWNLDEAGRTFIWDSEFEEEPLVFRLAGISGSKLVVTQTQTWPEDGLSHTETMTFTAR